MLPPLWSDLAGDGDLLIGGDFEPIRVAASLGAGLRLSLGWGGGVERVVDRPRGDGGIERLLYPLPYPPRLGGEWR